MKIKKYILLFSMLSTCVWAEPNIDLNAITLTRFAIQSLYSPERLLITPPGVMRVPMRTQHQITFVYGAHVTATPLISWHGGDLYITAIELKNDLKKDVTIHPQSLLGNWQTATFFPSDQLKIHAHTTVLVTSDKPFHEALISQMEFVR